RRRSPPQPHRPSRDRIRGRRRQLNADSTSPPVIPSHSFYCSYVTVFLRTVPRRSDPINLHKSDLAQHTTPSYQSVAFWNHLSVGPIYAGISEPHKGSSGSVCPGPRRGQCFAIDSLFSWGYVFLQLRPL